MARLSRPCYDKPHRCPGWVGGGPKFPPGGVSRCDNGSIRTSGEGYPGEHRWRFGRCTKCDVVTLPWVTRKLSIPWWLDRFNRRF